MHAHHSMKSSSSREKLACRSFSLFLVIPLQTSSSSSSWLGPLVLFVLNNDRRMRLLVLISFSRWHRPSPSLLSSIVLIMFLISSKKNCCSLLCRRPMSMGQASWKSQWNRTSRSVDISAVVNASWSWHAC